MHIILGVSYYTGGYAASFKRPLPLDSCQKKNPNVIESRGIRVAQRGCKSFVAEGYDDWSMAAAGRTGKLFAQWADLLDMTRLRGGQT